MSIEDILKEEWRICILVSLSKMPGGAAYEATLQQAIARYHDQHLTREQVQAELKWLRDSGLLRLRENPTPQRISYTATITDRGVAVAEGRVRAPGVRQPEG